MLSDVLRGPRRLTLGLPLPGGEPGVTMDERMPSTSDLGEEHEVPLVDDWRNAEKDRLLNGYLAMTSESQQCKITTPDHRFKWTLPMVRRLLPSLLVERFGSSPLCNQLLWRTLTARKTLGPIIRKNHALRSEESLPPVAHQNVSTNSEEPTRSEPRESSPLCRLRSSEGLRRTK